MERVVGHLLLGIGIIIGCLGYTTQRGICYGRRLTTAVAVCSHVGVVRNRNSLPY